MCGTGERCGWEWGHDTDIRAPPSGESPTFQRPPVERTIESPMARPRQFSASQESGNVPVHQAGDGEAHRLRIGCLRPEHGTNGEKSNQAASHACMISV